MSPNILKKIFWDYKRSFVGLPFVIQALPKMIVPPAIVFGSLFVTEYILTSSTYYDEYDATASQFAITSNKK